MTSENTNPVTKRIAVKVDCNFVSPAIIGSGFGENTDSDILRDAAGNPFLPGSTVAGVLRAFCPDAEALFGVGDRISPLWVFDSTDLDGEAIILDGVALDRENKVAINEKKYDYEAVAIGARFTLRFLLTIRANDSDKGYETLLQKLVGALQSGEVAFGAKTRRGFGRISCAKIRQRKFDLSPGKTDDLMKWIDFDWQEESGWEEAKGEPYTAQSQTLSVKLKLEGSIMIRDIRHIYESKSINGKTPDYRHISIGGKPVILGTSWAGAVRSGLVRLLKPKYGENAVKYLDEVFGYVREGKSAAEDDVSEASLVSFGAATLTGKTKTEGYRIVTRVKIDRFMGGAADGALFTEEPWYGGETILEIRCPKDRKDVHELLILALDGIDKGLIQIGGESAVGRGFFKVLSINGKPLAEYATKPKTSLIAAIEATGKVGKEE